MVGKMAKTGAWLLRLLQLALAVILIGITSYLIHQFLQFPFPSHGPREVVVPLIFSVLALIFSMVGVAAPMIASPAMQAAVAFLDFCLFVGYVTSAGLLRRNYNGHGRDNELLGKITDGRLRSGFRSHVGRNNAIIKLLSGLVVIQLISYFFSMLMQAWMAKKRRDEMSSDRIVHDKVNRFSRTSNASSEVPAMGEQTTTTTYVTDNSGRV